MPFVPLDPKVAAKAIEGYHNELEAEKQGLDAFYRQFRCKRCQGALRKETLSKHTFSDPAIMTPRAVLRCLACDFLFDPHTGLVLELGNPDKLLGLPILGTKTTVT